MSRSAVQRRASKIRSASKQRGRRFAFEPLELRRVLAAHLDSGVLHVDGTSHSDVIAVSQNGANVTVTLNGKSQDFSASQVQSIDIRSGAGNDRVTIGQEVHLQVRVDGGDGNDTINAGSGDSTLIGGRGNDRITGGSGNDKIEGDAGSDQLSGGDGNDQIDGGAGNDDIQGGAGNDNLHGAAGNDRVFGGIGDDLCDGGIGKNLLQGDDGQDVFDNHSGDTVNDDATDDRQGDGFTVSGNETELEMSLQSSSLFARIKFQSETENGQASRTFQVETFGGNPGDSLAVVVGGVTVGTITVSNDGRGSLHLTDGDGCGSPFPSDFPAITSGLTISVGAASGIVPAQASDSLVNHGAKLVV